MDETLWQCKKCSHVNHMRYSVWNCERCDHYNRHVQFLPAFQKLKPVPNLKCKNRFQTMTIPDTVQYYRNCLLESQSCLPDDIVDIITSYVQLPIGIGCMLDVQDKYRKWAVAIIREVRNGVVRIHYVGWNVRYDEWISPISRRLRPWQSHTTYYGSPQPIPLTEDEIRMYLGNTKFDSSHDEVRNCLEATSQGTLAMNMYEHKYGIPEDLI